MFCSDDKHPDSLLAGHIDRLCARAVAKGIDSLRSSGPPASTPSHTITWNMAN
jgi:adenine deaminase